MHGHTISDTMNQTPVKSENLWRVVSLILLALLVISNGFQLYKLIDQSVMLSEMRVGMRTIRSDLGTLRDLTPLLSGGRKKSDVLLLLGRSSPGALVMETDSTIGIGQMRFVFDRDGTLIRIDEL
jgi:hypothetical protein